MDFTINKQLYLTRCKFIADTKGLLTSRGHYAVRTLRRSLAAGLPIWVTMVAVKSTVMAALTHFEVEAVDKRVCDIALTLVFVVADVFKTLTRTGLLALAAIAPQAALGVCWCVKSTRALR